MKFAYLIMAHDNVEQLKKLLKVLDWEENEIFLHVDKKSEHINVDTISTFMCNAKIHIYQKFSVYWADITQTLCQIYLLQEASKTYHDYYHLLSGHDLPIKSHKEICSFFERNKGKQFVHFESEDICLKEQCRYYHFLDHNIKKEKNSHRRKFLESIENISLSVQRRLCIKRKIYCGANWYSITQELADDFCKEKYRVLKKVLWTVSSDEYVLQTFLRCISRKKYKYYSQLCDKNNYLQICREIDWERGNPYVWRIEDYEYLKNSEYMYARKFDEKIDNQIIEVVCNSMDA